MERVVADVSYLTDAVDSHGGKAAAVRKRIHTNLRDRGRQFHCRQHQTIRKCRIAYVGNGRGGQIPRRDARLAECAVTDLFQRRIRAEHERSESGAFERPVSYGGKFGRRSEIDIVQEGSVADQHDIFGEGFFRIGRFFVRSDKR